MFDCVLLVYYNILLLEFVIKNDIAITNLLNFNTDNKDISNWVSYITHIIYTSLNF